MLVYQIIISQIGLIQECIFGYHRIFIFIELFAFIELFLFIYLIIYYKNYLNHYLNTYQIYGFKHNKYKSKIGFIKEIMTSAVLIDKNGDLFIEKSWFCRGYIREI